MRLLSVFTIAVFFFPLALLGQSVSRQEINRVFSGKFGKETVEFFVDQGSFLSIEVKQNSSDVRIALFSPAGKQISESDVIFSEQETERILLITGEHGVYRLEVAQKFPEEKGNVVLKVKQSPSTSQDRDLVEAESLWIRSQALRRKGRDEDRIKAIETVEMALELWRRAGSQVGEARSLAMLSFMHRILRNQPKSIEIAENILRMPDTAELHPFKIDAYYQLGQIQFLNARADDAIETFKTALKTFRSPSPQMALLFNAIGNCYQTKAEFELAQEAFDQALENLKLFPDMYSEAQIRHTMGLMFITSKDFNAAIDNLKIAAKLREKYGFRRGVGSALAPLGMSYYYNKQLPESFEALEKARSISKELEDRETLVYALSCLAVNYRETGDPLKALTLLNQAVGLYKDHEKDSTELNSAYITLGTTLTQEARYTEARGNFERALRGYEKAGDLDGVTRTLYQFAKLERAENKLAAAKEKIERSLEIHEYVQSAYNNISALSSFLEARRGYFDLYIDVLMQLSREKNDPSLSMKALQVSENARMRTLIWYYRESLKENSSASIEPRLANDIQRAQRQIGLNLSELSKIQGQAGKTQKIVEIQNMIARLNREEESLRAQLRQRNPRIANLTQPPKLSLSEMQAELDSDSALVEYSLGQERSYLWILTTDSVQSFELPKRSEVDDSAREYYKLLAQPAQAVSRPSSDNKRIKRTLEDVRNAARQLSRLISIEKISQLPVKRLLFVADGALNLIPFSSLPGSDQHSETIADKYESVSLPSLTTLHVVRKENSKAFVKGNLMIFGDPVFTRDDTRFPKHLRSKIKGSATDTDLARSLRSVDIEELPRLPFSREEAEKIGQISGGSSNLNLSFEASRERLQAHEIKSTDILHFATHGVLNRTHPELSGIVLSLFDKDGRSKNGFLRTQDLYSLRLRAQMAVLSACQTGLGKEVENEGMIGLTRGLLANGTPRVVSTLWKVDDRATADFMQLFYTALIEDSQPPSTALRTAQNRMKAIPRYSNPRYWAGFVLTGEWR